MRKTDYHNMEAEGDTPTYVVFSGEISDAPEVKRGKKTRLVLAIIAVIVIFSLICVTCGDYLLKLGIHV